MSRGDAAETPTLVITNDFPPTVGGIEGFVADLCDLLDGNVVVLTRRTPGWRDHDRRLAYPVFRTTDLLLPTEAVAQKAIQLIRTYRISRVIYGALAPLALLAPRLRAHGVWQLGITHGHEVWWARVPATRQLLRRMADALDRVSVISSYTRTRIEPALSAAARRRVVDLPPPVDLQRFRPAAAAATPPADDPPVARCIAAGRMVRQKGHHVLLDAWRSVLDAAWPLPPELVLIGHGPQAGPLRRQAARLRLGGTVRFVGATGRDRVAALMATGNVFALPVQTRLGGLRPEGLGKVFTEAAASGMPVIAGRSGGAPETLVDGRTGHLVDSRDPAQVADRIVRLLSAPDQAAAFGRAGREYVAYRFGPGQVRDTLRRALGLPVADAGGTAWHGRIR